MANTFFHRFVLAAAGLMASASLLASDCDPAQRGCVEQGTWQFSVALGLGARSNPLADGDTIALPLLPRLSYVGERFFLDNLDMGVSLWDDNRHRVNLLITPGYDQLFFQRWNPLNIITNGATGFSPERDKGMDAEHANNDNSSQQIDNELLGPEAVLQSKARQHKRRMSGLAGLEYQYQLGSWWLQAQWLSEITGLYDGEERRVLLGHDWQWQRQQLSAALGAIWQDEKTINYYYGTPFEYDGTRSRYTAKAGVSPQVRIDWRYRVNSQWDLTAWASYRHLADSISDSPLVNERGVTSLFIGGVYHF